MITAPLLQLNNTSALEDYNIKKEHPTDCIIALAGNPNVGKSTVFNALTGMHQHTGNWPGKTVTNARGICSHHGKKYILVDIPGTYSLLSHSKEEEAARDFLCYGNIDAAIAVCDATCLERNLNLVLQILEITPKVVVCINLMDEAKKKKIDIDQEKLSTLLGVPVVTTSAKRKAGLTKLMDTVEQLLSSPPTRAYCVTYPQPIESAISSLATYFQEENKTTARRTAKQLLEQNEFPKEFSQIENLENTWNHEKELLNEQYQTKEAFQDAIVSSLVKQAEKIGKEVLHFGNEAYETRDRKIDRLLTGKLTGIPLMLLLFAGIFWLTITGANYPSQMLSQLFTFLEKLLYAGCVHIGLPTWVCEMLCSGIFRVVGWIVSVMLPPMAIFFPLFTLLEDLGYLPRIAFNMDKAFQSCKACGKQALTMCMGFGCNAAGVVGCRIIDSPRERLIAVLTNSFVPCNGRFPTLIALITIFFAGSSPYSSLWQALYLTLAVALGVLMTFLVSRFLSKTILRGHPSSFALELPPYRKPNIGKILIRSVFDRTLYVLGRALAVAAPAGLVLWLCANVQIGSQTILTYISQFLNPFAGWVGLDGVILTAFLLGLPANEIVVPIMLMAYLSKGSLEEASSLLQMKAVFLENGWTQITAICTMVFCLFHWPCSTTLLTIKKETKSSKWMIVSALLPALVGLILCFLIHSVSRLFY